MIKLLKPLDDQISLMGMSCSGKTTFAGLLEHEYYCFDALFPWHQIETFGMSITKSLDHVARCCVSERFVLDGWHTADLEGKHLPPTSVYVIYSSYNHIVSQYRRQVLNHLEYFPMYRKWYSYNNPEARYFFNQGDFIENDFHPSSYKKISDYV